GSAGLEISVDDNTPIELEACLPGKRQTWMHADADHDEVRLERSAALEHGAILLDRSDGIAEMEDDAMLLVQLADEIAHLDPEDALHRALFRRYHVDLDAADAQRRRRFEANEARADHDRAGCALGALDDG